MFTVRSLPFIEYFLTLHIQFSPVFTTDYQIGISRQEFPENMPKKHLCPWVTPWVSHRLRKTFTHSKIVAAHGSWLPEGILNSDRE